MESYPSLVKARENRPGCWTSLAVPILTGRTETALFIRAPGTRDAVPRAGAAKRRQRRPEDSAEGRDLDWLDHSSCGARLAIPWAGALIGGPASGLTGRPQRWPLSALSEEASCGDRETR